MTQEVKIRPSNPIQQVRLTSYILKQVWLNDWRNIAIALNDQRSKREIA